MSEVIRASSPGDEEKLKMLWKRCFGDSDEDIGLFFDKIYSPGGAIVTETDGKIVSMAYLLYTGDAVLGSGETYPCSMVYAVGTNDEFRGRGYAAKETCAAVFQGFGMGAPVATICPASENLFDFYRDGAGFSDYFYGAEMEFDGAPSPGFSGIVRDVDFTEYGAAREKLLNGRFHIRLNDKFLNFQYDSCKESGGGMLLFDIDGEVGCAAVELYAEEARVKELLIKPELAAAAVSAIANRFSAKKYIIRTPVGKEHCFGELRRVAMAVGDGSTRLERDIYALPWYGFTFD